MRTIDRLEAVLEWLQPQGLDGLEALHKPYPEETRQSLLDLAERRRLLVVAGSDFHGPHHKDGTDPAVDMPLEHWHRLADALKLGAETSREVALPGPLALSEERLGP